MMDVAHINLLGAAEDRTEINLQHCSTSTMVCRTQLRGLAMDSLDGTSPAGGSQ